MSLDNSNSHRFVSLANSFPVEFSFAWTVLKKHGQVFLSPFSKPTNSSNLSTSDIATLGKNTPFKSASLIKIPILLQLFLDFQNNILDPNEQIEVKKEDMVQGAGTIMELAPGHRFSLLELARLMIVVSDNIATNLIIERLSKVNTESGTNNCFSRVNNLLKSMGALDTVLNRKMMEDPKVRGENLTTAFDCVRILQTGYCGDLLSAQWKNQFLTILRRQQFIEKIPALMPCNVVTANKTGELDYVRCDMAIIEKGDNAYAMAVLTKDEGIMSGDKLVFQPPCKVDMAISELARACFDFLEC